MTLHKFDTLYRQIMSSKYLHATCTLAIVAQVFGCLTLFRKVTSLTPTHSAANTTGVVVEHKTKQPEFLMTRNVFSTKIESRRILCTVLSSKTMKIICIDTNSFRIYTLGDFNKVYGNPLTFGPNFGLV